MSWWRSKELPDKAKRPDKAIFDWRRFNDNLTPIVQSELDRGNALVPPGRWEKHSDIDGRGASVYQLHLRYELDTEAIDAEFILPEGTTTSRGAIAQNDYYYLIVGDHPADAARQDAVRAWWQAWEDGPQTRIPIALYSSRTIFITPPDQEPDHER